MMNEDPKAHSDASAPDTAIFVEATDYDRHDAKAGLIAAVSGGVLLVLVVMIVGVYWLYTVSYEKVEQDVYTGVTSKDLEAIHAREDELLHKYSYVDKEKGVVRIPIDKAIELVAAEYKDGQKVFYNTTSYPVKAELPGGAAGGANPPAPAAAPAPVAPAAVAPTKAAH